jgi:lathosterol oxidase
MVQLMCSLADYVSADSGFDGWVRIWLAYSFFGYIALTLPSAAAFVYLYGRPTYDKWRWKTNPKYPSATYVAGELFLGGILGPFGVSVVSSIHLYLIQPQGPLRHHCETPLTWEHRLVSLVMAVVLADFYEWFWHYLGHWVDSLWMVHKHHHKYYNPTPFGTIADYPMDNFMRSLYVVFVYAASYALFGQNLDIDMLYLPTAFINAFYGIYMHAGHEVSFLPWDHKIINTSFQHYVHHSVSVKNKPLHTGFFIKLWDNLAGSVYEGTQVIPAVVDQKLGNRSLERWEKEVKPNLPDYSVLLSPRFWYENWRLAPGLNIMAP